MGDHVLRQQLLERLQIAAAERGQEAASQLVPTLLGRLEAGPARLDVLSGTGNELPGIVLADADDGGDLLMGVLEDVA